jgi:hypothetical protein
MCIYCGATLSVGTDKEKNNGDHYEEAKALKRKGDESEDPDDKYDFYKKALALDPDNYAAKIGALKVRYFRSNSVIYGLKNPYKTLNDIARDNSVVSDDDQAIYISASLRGFINAFKKAGIKPEHYDQMMTYCAELYYLTDADGDIFAEYQATGALDAKTKKILRNIGRGFGLVEGYFSIYRLPNDAAQILKTMYNSFNEAVSKINPRSDEAVAIIKAAAQRSKDFYIERSFIRA